MTILKFETNRKKAKTCPCGRNNKDGKFAPFKGYDDKGYCFSCDKTFPIDAVRNVIDRTHNDAKYAPVSYLPIKILERSVMQCKRCEFYSILVKLFKEDVAMDLCLKYHIGSNKDGITAFWQVDISGNVRECKTIPFRNDGHRDQSRTILFRGKKILNDDNANLKLCYFGEDLLSLPENFDKPVALFESEKSAVIASIYYPEFVCIATGGKHGAKWTEKNVCKVLAGKSVILFPDADAYESWESKSSKLGENAGCTVAVSDHLEKNATSEEKVNGFDIADYLLRLQDGTGLALSDNNYPIFWDHKK